MKNDYTLLKTPVAQRDEKWELRLLTELPTWNVTVMKEDPQAGPDGFPYLFLETSEAASEPMSKILAWLSVRGIGLVLNPKPPYPDYVLTYGMIWNYREQGEFVSSFDPGKAEKTIEWSNVNVRPPSEKDVPQYVRTLLKQFFLDHGIENPQMLMVSGDGEEFELAFSLESLGSPPVEEQKQLGEALSWFFPNHYSIILVQSDFEGHFVSL